MNERRLSATIGASAFPRIGEPFESWGTYPLVPTVKDSFVDTFERFKTGTPKEYFGVDRLREAYEAGERVFTKGSYGMGLCEVVDAPCAYFTVLRDPMSQFLSHYKYSCLAGAEDRRIWSDEMKTKGVCDLDLLSWFDYLHGDTWLHLLAPGKSSDLDEQVEVAKRNLEKPCFRFILTEDFEDGLKKLTERLPDFAELDIDALNEHANKNASPPLDPALQARFQTYIEDEKIMNELRSRLKRPFQVYKHAKNIYEHKWASPLESC
jgi:hypothetical protein